MGGNSLNHRARSLGAPDATVGNGLRAVPGFPKRRNAAEGVPYSLCQRIAHGDLGRPGLAAILGFVLLALAPSPTAAQCAPDRCPRQSAPHPAVVRVANVAADGNRCYGSGTLVHKDAERGVVLTCAHLFRENVGDLVVTFPDARPLDAELLAVDPDWDLAALAVVPPQTAPVAVAGDHPRPGDPLRSCGYGFDGRFWCNQGRALGYVRTANTPTYETLEISGRARDGDSGGPVFNERGELAAVLWGTDGRIVGGTYCGRIRKFLARILSLGHGGREPATVPITPGAPSTDPEPNAPDGTLDKIRQRLDDLKGRLDAAQQDHDEREQSWSRRLEKLEGAVALVGRLRERVQQAEQTVGSDNLRAVVREVAGGILADRGPSLLHKLLPGLLAALGWTGPPSLAAIVALRLAGGILRRRLARRRRRSSNTETDAGQSGPSGRSNPAQPLNDDYARQLAGVYALSGRSPTADATLGREYDEELRQAEESSDAALARWARALRERVARRFYRIHDPSPTPAEE